MSRNNDGYTRAYRSVYKISAHIVLVVKYRRKILTAVMLDRLHEILRDTCQKWKAELIEFNGEADHVHFLVSYPPDVALSKFIGNLKTVSSRLLRKEFNPRHSESAFWTASYFVASCGGVTLEQLKRYVQQQDRPADVD